MAELEKCPFCGAKQPEVHLQKLIYPLEDCTRWKVMCESCGAEMSEFVTPEQAIAAWNRRVDNG